MKKNKKSYKFYVLGLALLVFVAVISYSIKEKYLPMKYIKIIEKYSAAYGLDAELVCGLINIESRFNKDAVSPAGAKGLMQLMDKTAEWGAREIGISNFTLEMVFEPEINIRIGCWYLKELIEQYGVFDTAIAAYNGGSGNVSSWLKNNKYSNDGKELLEIPFAETKKYVKNVNLMREVYYYLLMFQR